MSQRQDAQKGRVVRAFAIAALAACFADPVEAASVIYAEDFSDQNRKGVSGSNAGPVFDLDGVDCPWAGI